MKNIICDHQTGYGGVWQLVQYDEDFFAFDTKTSLDSFYGPSVDNCGTKEEVLHRLGSLLLLNQSKIKEYANKHFDFLINQTKIEIEMLNKFINTLNNF